MKTFNFLALILISLLTYSCSVDSYLISQSSASSDEKVTAEITQNRPTNVIFLLGDGMGMNHIEATRRKYYRPGEKLNMEELPFKAFVTTTPADERKITDSAAGATALATGHKTTNRMVGVTPDKKPKTSILEALKKNGYATGIITTSEIVDASPASYYAHIESRYKSEEIGWQLVNKDIDLIIGAPGPFQNNHKLLSGLTEKGYQLVKSKDQLLGVGSSPVVAFFDGWGSEQTDLDVWNDDNYPKLAICVKKALDVLSKGDQGFFLFVEDEGIDTGSHKNLDDFTLNRVKHLDDAVAEAISFATKNKNTLVIVTADHETGGLTLVEDRQSSTGFKLKWERTGHTGQPVPLFAFGPNAELFEGTPDNTDVPKILGQLLELENFPDPE